MTNKEGCAGTYPVQGYTRADGTEVSGYMRTCGAAHNSDNTNDKLQRRADTLYPTMKDDKVKIPDKFLSLGANLENSASASLSKFQSQQLNAQSRLNAQIKISPQQEQNTHIKTNQEKVHHSIINELGVDHIDKGIVYIGAKGVKGEEATENLLMSKKDHYMNTDYAKERLIYNNYEELRSEDFKKYFKEKITQQIGADKLENTKGIYFNFADKSSIEMGKVLTNNSKFIQGVIRNRKLLENRQYINSSIEFTDTNFHNAVGKADIRNMHINGDGDLDFYVTDVYDFNDDKNAPDLVQVGRDRQEKGEIIPYFYIYHVIIPKYERFKAK